MIGGGRIGLKKKAIEAMEQICGPRLTWAGGVKGAAFLRAQLESSSSDLRDQSIQRYQPSINPIPTQTHCHHFQKVRDRNQNSNNFFFYMERGAPPRAKRRFKNSEKRTEQNGTTQTCPRLSVTRP